MSLPLPELQTISEILASRTLSALAPFAPKPLPVRRKFRYNEGTKIPVSLNFARFFLPLLGELRWTTLNSNRVDIIALMLFPNDPETLPVFASEFVVIGGKCKAAVVDLQSLSCNAATRQEHHQPISALSVNYTQYNTDQLPDWCDDHFSPYAIAALKVDLDSIETLLEGYSRYLEAFLDLAMTKMPVTVANEELLRQYKDHHITHTPGRPFMTAAFGEEWTERFLRQGMYG